MKSHYADLLGGRIHYGSYGSERESARETYVFLHGNSSSARAFESVAHGFAPDTRIIGVDLPGHGLSDGHAHFKKYYSFQGLREVLLRLFETIGLEPTGLIGHSMGGHIATQAARDIPSLSRLVLISSPPIAGRDALAGFFRPDAPTNSIFAEKLSASETRELARAFTSPNAPIRALEEIETDIGQTDGVFRSELGVSLGGADVIDELAITKALRGIDVLLIGGEADRFIDPAYYSRVIAEIGLSGEQSRILPGVGHYPHLEAPDLTLQIVAAWLERTLVA